MNDNDPDIYMHRSDTTEPIDYSYTREDLERDLAKLAAEPIEPPPADLEELRLCLWHFMEEATPMRYGIEEVPDKLDALEFVAKLDGHLPLKGNETLQSVAAEVRLFIQAGTLQLLGLLSNEYRSYPGDKNLCLF